MGSNNSTIRQMNEDKYLQLPNQTGFKQSGVCLIQDKKTNLRFLSLRQIFQNQDAFQTYQTACMEFKTNKISFLQSLDHHYDQKVSQGCSDHYLVDLIFEYMDNTLVQISEDFHIKQLYYSEEEIWYVVQKAMEYLDFYNSKGGEVNYGQIDPFQARVDQNGKVKYFNFVFFQDFQKNQYFKNELLKELKLEKAQNNLLSIAALIFKMANLKVKDYNYNDQIDQEYYNHSMNTIKSNYSVNLFNFTNSLINDNHQNVKYFLHFLSKIPKVVTHINLNKKQEIIKEPQQVEQTQPLKIQPLIFNHNFKMDSNQFGNTDTKQIRMNQKLQMQKMRDQYLTKDYNTNTFNQNIDNIIEESQKIKDSPEAQHQKQVSIISQQKPQFIDQQYKKINLQQNSKKVSIDQNYQKIDNHNENYYEKQNENITEKDKFLNNHNQYESNENQQQIHYEDHYDNYESNKNHQNHFENNYESNKNPYENNYENNYENHYENNNYDNHYDNNNYNNHYDNNNYDNNNYDNNNYESNKNHTYQNNYENHYNQHDQHEQQNRDKSQDINNLNAKGNEQFVFQQNFQDNYQSQNSYNKFQQQNVMSFKDPNGDLHDLQEPQYLRDCQVDPYHMDNQQLKLFKESERKLEQLDKKKQQLYNEQRKDYNINSIFGNSKPTFTPKQDLKNNDDASNDESIKYLQSSKKLQELSHKLDQNNIMKKQDNDYDPLPSILDSSSILKKYQNNIENVDNNTDQFQNVSLQKKIQNTKKNSINYDDGVNVLDKANQALMKSRKNDRQSILEKADLAIRNASKSRVQGKQYDQKIDQLLKSSPKQSEYIRMQDQNYY